MSGVRGWRQTPGSPEGFLEQQNSQRDALIAALNINIFARNAERVRGANIAQMVNVLQAMIFTRQGEDAADADVSRVPPVPALPGRNPPAGDSLGGEYQHGDIRLAARWTPSRRATRKARPGWR